MRVALLFFVCYSFSLKPIWADDARSVFEELFGPAIKAAKASSERNDDIALAKRMVSLAKQASTDVSLAVLLCEHACELIPPTAEAMPNAREAFERWREVDSKNTTRIGELEIDYLQRAFARARSKDQKTVGNELVNSLVNHANRLASTGDHAAAVVNYRRAVLIATRIKHADVDKIKAALNATLQRQKVNRQVSLFEQRLLKDRSDDASAVALVRLYLFELNDPTAAIPYLSITGDKELSRQAANAAKRNAELTTLEKIELADFFIGNAADISDQGKSSTLIRSLGLYQAAIQSPDIDSLNRTKASVKLREIQKRLTALKASGAVALNQPPAKSSRGFAKFKVAGSGYEIVEWKNKAKAFSNRGYAWKEVPDIFKGWSITRVGGGGRSALTLTITADGNVLIALASGEHKGIQSLEGKGWKQVEQRFKYTAGGGTSMTILRQSFPVGQTINIPRYGWTNTLVLVPPK